MADDRIADAFSQAAEQYDLYARLQKGVATTLADWLTETATGAGIDLGCGTGPTARLLQQRAPDIHWFGVDLADGMLRELLARGRASEHYRPLQATATALPFADKSLRYIYSSFSLQWVAEQAALAEELHRVLASGGELLLALPLVGSLSELSAVYQQVGLRSPVNKLPDYQGWHAQLTVCGFQLQQQVLQTFTEYYADFAAVHRMIKGTGAHVRLNAEQTVLRKSDYQALQQAYELLRQPAGLPVSWQVAFWRWQK